MPRRASRDPGPRGRSGGKAVLMPVKACLMGTALIASLAQAGDATVVRFDTGKAVSALSREEPRPVSNGAAYTWALLGTAAPFLFGIAILGHGPSPGKGTVGFTLVGMTVGPSLGQFYAGSQGRGLIGSAIRGSGLLMAGIGLDRALSDPCKHDPDGDTPCDEAGAGELMTLGLLTYAWGTLYSLIDTRFAVDRFNAKLAKGADFGWSPLLVPGPEGSTRTGALAWIRF
jgi:hypothetical protein